MSTADTIWNRAAMQSGGTNPQPGDMALSAALRLHSLAMSGGLLDAVERLTESDLDRAERGYQWLGIDQAVEVVRFVRSQVADAALDDDNRAEFLEHEADNRYAEIVPDDETLVAALKQRLEQQPEAFAPV